MKVLVVGGGGREHAIIWKLSQSPKIDKIYCAPGNGGIAQVAECVDIHADAVDRLAQFALDKSIGFTVVGPEVPLVNGIVDEFEKKGLRCFGPNRLAAEIEGSKVFSKHIMKKYNIPTADYREFDSPDEAREYLKTASYPLVIKADGLAAGKGVVIAKDLEEALGTVHDIMECRVFKDAGDKIIIEEFLEGPEVSVLAFTDGKTVCPMVSARDHKRINDNDEGPNTGGMGTISPASGYTDDIADYCMGNIFIPTIKAMDCEGRKFKGVLFFGLMLTSKGPKVLEYNCRLGDPETQAVLPRLKTDLADIMEAIIDERLADIDIEWSKESACCVVLSSGGYPGEYERGKKIKGLETMPEGIMVFHSGTKYREGNIVTDGGRVLGVASMGDSVKDACGNIYNIIDDIYFEGMHYRSDIGIEYTKK